MRTLFLILLLSLSAFAQKLEYDKFRDESIASIELGGSLFLTKLEAAFPGQKVTSNPTQFYLLFAPAPRQCRGYCFNDAELIILIGGERLRFSDKGLNDTAGFILERSLVEKLAAANSVEFQVSRYPSGTWKTKDLAKIKALLDAVTVK